MSLSSAHPLIAVKPVRAHPSRRGSVRVAAMLPVELLFTYSADSSIPARSIDIGMGGMCVQTASIVDAEAIRAVRFQMGANRVHFDVGSRWTTELGGNGSPATGLIFDSLDDASRDALWDFIQLRGRDLGLFLSSCEGLDQLNFEEALELALATRLREVAAGDIIYKGGDAPGASTTYILMSGSAVLEPANGRFSQQIARVRPRELFGGLPVAAGCAPFERAVAVEDCRILEFSGYAVENLLNTKPHLGVCLLRATNFHWMSRFADTLARTLT